jgi:hypothetical protein
MVGVTQKHRAKNTNNGYIRGCPKRPAFQIGSLEILGIKHQFEKKHGCKFSIEELRSLDCMFL